MILTFYVFHLFLLRGVVGDLPPCFSHQITWHSDDMVDAVLDVDTAFICQEMCAVSNCSGFTWYSEHSEHFPRICALYHTLSREEQCSHCISGPASCTCSGSYGCDVTSDNAIDILTSTQSETKCQNICFNTPGCNVYTYYNYLNVMQDFCYLLKSCDQIDESCTGCFSGPGVCSASTTSTTNSPTTSNTFTPTTTFTTTTVSTTTTSTSTTTTTTSSPTPTTTSYDPCTNINYSILSDSTRNVNHGHEDYCDYSGFNPSPDWKGAGWYRLQEPAGTMIPEYPPDAYHCGTYETGWLNGKHPNHYEEVTRTVCFHSGSHTCFYSSEVKVKNCGEYYLYNLPEAPACRLRYCAV